MLVIAEDDADIGLRLLQRLGEMSDRFLAGVEARAEFFVRALLIKVVLRPQIDQLFERVGLAVEPVLRLGPRAVAVRSPLLRGHRELRSVRRSHSENYLGQDGLLSRCYY